MQFLRENRKTDQLQIRLERRQGGLADPFGAGHRPKPIRHRRSLVNMPYNNCVSRRSWDRPVSGKGNQTNRLHLWEKLGALKPEFAFAGSMTLGPFSRPATHSWLEEPVFGWRIDAVSTETGRWNVPLNTQAIPGHDFPTSDIT